jgi:thioester reductase-like protein
MKKLVHTYSDLEQAHEQRIALTGATGIIGAHVLAQLVTRPDVESVYCLVPAEDDETAIHRVRESLIRFELYELISFSHRMKISALASDVLDARLGLSAERYEAVASKLTSVIHYAWNTGPHQSLMSFEDCITGVRNLLYLCFANPASERATFSFCSCAYSIAECTGSRSPGQFPGLDVVPEKGFVQSMCPAEHLCMATTGGAGTRTRVLRVGSVVADATRVNNLLTNTKTNPPPIQLSCDPGVIPGNRYEVDCIAVDIIAHAVADVNLAMQRHSSEVAINTSSPFISKESSLDVQAAELTEWLLELGGSLKSFASGPIKWFLDSN